MDVTLKELRIQPGRILSMAEGGAEVIITVRGVPKAKIVPLNPVPTDALPESTGFGLWADRHDLDDINGYVRGLRKGRQI